ncbi:MAG: amidohydrolase [Deltaproteobacteria bacterium]|nr:amidohydrolase [Deltaproteobacteria bacterium]MBW2019623.1 amidohydrolase [Deltaproteobacteria bacterium]MBW2074438.1 amidohydrolase [Deltaproteobacteria bacterium]RLB82378.1 MAG: amidohydrolase [Deltaproteobacteria bacterium]
MQKNTGYDIVIHNGTVLTVSADFDVLNRGLVCIADGRLKRVEERAAHQPLPAARHVIDARGGIIMPGLVNTHTHAAMSLFRGLADDLPLMTWLNEYVFKAEGRWLNPESVHAGALLSCAEMLLSGTTTFCDGYFFEDAVAAAVQASGMRAILAQGIVDFPAPGVHDPKKNVAEAVRFIEEWNGKTPLITPGLFCHSPYTCSEETLKAARRVADETGTLFQIHVAETQSEVRQIEQRHGTSPVQYLERIGVLNASTLVVHAIWVNEPDMACMARRRVGVSVTTESEMKLASGVAPIPEFLRKGLAVGIGTDGCASNNNLDLFQEMDTTAKLHKVKTLDPTVLDARQVLTLATRGGAEAIGLGKQIGSLEVDKKADLIIIDTHKPHLTPLYDPVSHLVYAVTGGDVRDVIIDGRLIVKDRALLTFNPETTIGYVAHLARKIASQTSPID